MSKQDIKDFTLEELEKRLAEMAEPPYRGRQIFDWLYRKGAAEFSRMQNLPKDLQEKLGSVFYISRPEVLEIVSAADGTEKILFRLADKNLVETVFLPERKRKTVCLSTQVGCKYNCAFCASGQNGFTRNLSLAEIVNQLLFIIFERKQQITNVVFMGMGEPFDNYENLVRAIDIINHPMGLGIGSRKITVSTCGIIPGIERFQTLEKQFELSVSLHAPDEEMRQKLMPVSRKYPLEKLVPVLADYTKKTGRVVTLEYLLIKDFNDSPDCVAKLADIVRRLKARVNLLGYSPVAGKEYQPPEKDDIKLFADRLRRAEIPFTIRKSRGKEIEAACGQLAGKKTGKKENEL